VDLKNLVRDLKENVQLYPLCDTCFKGRKEVGKPEKYEFKEEKIAFLIVPQYLCMRLVSFVYGELDS
jgi:hypothetical protein